MDRLRFRNAYWCRSIRTGDGTGNRISARTWLEMTAPLSATDQEFEQVVLEAHGLVIVQFFALFEVWNSCLFPTLLPLPAFHPGAPRALP